MRKALRIAINAQRKAHSISGGAGSVLLGLITALGRLNDGDEEYVIIGPEQKTDWLKPYLGENQRLVSAPRTDTSRAGPDVVERLKRSLGPLRPFARKFWLRMVPSIPMRLWPDVPISDGFYEKLGCDVIHFPYQEFILCALPSIFNPHDLLHLHNPQFFTPATLAWRETIYPAACHFARTIVVASHWVKEDIVYHYRVAPEKVQIIPWAAPTQVYTVPSRETLEAVKQKYSLKFPYAFYPSATWEHKNHLRLLEALERLRTRQSFTLQLVCTGYQDPIFWPRIEQALRRLNLEGQVKFLGVVPAEDLRAIYRLAQFVIVPTLFEAASGPVFEAWLERTPVACSTVTSLPEQVADAAMFFDPLSAKAIAEAVRRMATDGHLRADLVKKGELRLLDFSWERSAKAYRAVYRRAAGLTLSEEDAFLLSWDWMKYPKRGGE